jgi:hypothetical protein
MGFTPVNEQETTISYCRDSKTVKVWSSDRTVWTRLDKICKKSTEYACLEEQKDKDGDVIAKVYLIKDKSLLTFRSAKKVMTDAQKELARERFKKEKK